MFKKAKKQRERERERGRKREEERLSNREWESKGERKGKRKSYTVWVEAWRVGETLSQPRKTIHSEHNIIIGWSVNVL